jgi:hypothetical protein
VKKARSLSRAPARTVRACSSQKGSATSATREQPGGRNRPELGRGRTALGKQRKKQVALDLFPENGELFAEMICFLGQPQKLGGSLLVNFKAGKMEADPVFKFSGKVGEQQPEYYETATGEEIKDVLLTKLGGDPWEQQGITVTWDQTDEEALEVTWFI